MFSNLVNRLKQKRVLTKKWAVLYLLFSIADPPLLESPASRADTAASRFDQETLLAQEVRVYPDQRPKPPGKHAAGSFYEPVGAQTPRDLSPGRANREPRPSAVSEDDLSRIHRKSRSDESALLQDLLFALQGVNSRSVSCDAKGGWTINADVITWRYCC